MTTDRSIVKEFPPIQKDDNLQLRITLKNYHSKTYVDIREYWQPEDSLEYIPLKKGVTIPVDDSLEDLETTINNLKEIYDELDKMVEEAESAPSRDDS